MRMRLWPAAGLALVLVTGCATRAAPPAQTEPLGKAVSQPFRDLSLIREEPPPLLLSAREAPYASPADCAAIRQELAALNATLGPDLDEAEAAAGEDGAELVSDLLQGVLGLPFRGVVRRVTGAHRRDKQKAEAIVAGVARRGYLRGLVQGRGC